MVVHWSWGGSCRFRHTAVHFSTADEMAAVPVPVDSRFSSLNDRFDREQMSATISYSVGVALIGVVLFLTDKKHPTGLFGTEMG